MICDDEGERGERSYLFIQHMESNDLHRGGSAEGWTAQSVSFNRSCLQWLGNVDRGSSSA